LVGRRPVGNIRQLTGGGYRLRFQRNGEAHTAPEIYRTRAGAEQALWAMTNDGRADCNHDRRYRALVLLATFASLRWGEATALRRCDIDLDAGTVRVRAAYAERSAGELILGPPKSKADRRIVGIPPCDTPRTAQPPRSPSASPTPARSPSPEPRAARRAGATSTARILAASRGRHRGTGPALHDLRHTGNTFAASSSAGLRDLMARMGHDSERAALIYQHEARGADTAITNAIDAHVDAQRTRDDSNDDGLPSALIPAG
jgi:integrase